MTVLRVARAFMERGWAGRMTYRFAWVFDLFGVVVFLAALFYIGRLVPPEMVAGHDWFTMTALGVGVYAFLGALTAGPRGFFLSELGFGTLEVLLTLGPSVGSMVTAATLLQVMRGLGRVLTLFLVAAFFGWSVPAHRVVILLPILLLSGMAAIGAGLIQAALDLRIRRAGRMLAMTGGLGAIMSGVYFPVTLLPLPLRYAAELLPTMHAIRAGRALLLGGDGLSSSIVALAILAAILLPAGLLAFRAALRSMREDGSFLTP